MILDKEDWIDEAERLYFVKGVTVDDWFDFIRKLLSTAMETEKSRIVKEMIEKIEKFNVPLGWGTASGGIMKQAVINYLKKVEANEND